MDEALFPGVEIDLPDGAVLPVGNVEITVRTEMQDSVGFRLGGSYLLRPELELRGGYGFESSAAPSQTTSVLYADGDKHTLSIGASWQAGPVAFDVSYAMLLIPDREVSDSVLVQANNVDASLAIPVGNGTYVSMFNVVAFGIRAQFGTGANDQ